MTEASGLQVLVCVKRVPQSSSTIVLTEDAQAVDGRYVGFTLSNHENCAIELAVRLADATGGRATALCVGSEEAVEQLVGALSLGCRAATLVVADAQHLGPADVAGEIAEVVRSHRAAGTTYDLVLLGNDASDTGDFQVGVRLAYALDLPVVNGVSTLEVADGVLTAHASVADGDETYSVPLPAVACVLEGGVDPRYPTIKGRIAAKKVSIEQRPPTVVPAGPDRVRLLLPPPQPSEVQILGEGPGAAAAVVDLFERLGVTT